MSLTPDHINAGFEFIATFALMDHIKTLYRDKRVAGFSLKPIMFYALWGAWNLIYYPSVGSMWSFWAGIGVFSVNLLYVGMIIYYKRNPSY